MNRRLAALLFVCGAWIATATAQQTPTVFPVEPIQLLGVLPAAPAEWKVIRSEAETTLSEWLETRATRVFQAPPAPGPANADVTSNALPPGELEITVVDTAGFAPALAAFANFAPGKNGNLEKKLIGTLPAIITKGESERQFVQVLVASRYLIEITMTNLPRHPVEDWLRSFHFDLLPQQSRPVVNRLREFRLSHIDELRPSNNRSYVVSTTNAKRVDDFLKTLPPVAPDSAPAEPGPDGQLLR
jgi:hypothetical protein